MIDPPFNGIDIKDVIRTIAIFEALKAFQRELAMR
jgi:hypothetical protein